jgi:hypothetical protein
VFINITKERIAKVFDSLDLGIVDKIDFVRKQGHKGPYHAVYVHLKYWLSTDASREFRNRLINNEDGAKLVYEDPWFWVVLPNTSEGMKPSDRKPSDRKPSDRKSSDSKPSNRNPRDRHETAAIKALRNAKSPIAPPYLERNAKVYPEEKAIKINIPHTPPHSPPHTPPQPQRMRDPPAVEKNRCSLTLENMEANLLAAEDLLARFPPRPRRESECSE